MVRVLAVLALLAHASALANPTPEPISASVRTLEARQLDIPSSPKCETKCKPLRDRVSSCPSEQTSCLCNQPTATQAEACAQCVYSANPSNSSMKQFQDLLDSYRTGCQVFGVSLAPFNITNGSPGVRAGAGVAVACGAVAGVVGSFYAL